VKKAEEGRCLLAEGARQRPALPMLSLERAY
jgi:hypothetical protein